MWEQAELDYMRGMKYKDIAEKYGVSINTVKSWKRRYQWDRSGMHTKKICGAMKDAHKGAHKNDQNYEWEKETRKKIYTEVIEKADLNDKQRLFCIFYMSSHNAVISYKRAYQCTYMAAAVSAHRLLKDPKIHAFINEMKDDRDSELLLRATDVVDMYMRIAFANMSDFVLVKKNKIYMADSDAIDGQIVQSIKPVKGGGVAIQLADRMKALKWLSEYFELNPKDKHRTDYNNKILELKKTKMEMEAW